MSFNDGDEKVNRRDDGQGFQIDARTVAILKDIFGSVANDLIIQEVVSSCRGNLTSSIECLMKITNSNELHLNGDTVCLGQTVEVNPHLQDTRNEASGPNSELPVLNTRRSYSTAIGLTENRDYVQQNFLVETSLNLKTNNMTIPNIINDINEGYRVLVLMRGLPGSGKTTLAKKIIESSVKENFSQHIFSTDDFFNTRNGYIYNVNRLTEAHDWNQSRVAKVLRKGISPILVDNTNLEIWTMQPYACVAVDNGYIIHILEPQTPWAHKPRLLAHKNVHNVPIDRIRKMSEKFQKDLTSDDLMKLLKLKYSPRMTPPILRTFPKYMPKEIKTQPPQFISSSISQVDETPQFCTLQNGNNPSHTSTNSNSYFCWDTGPDFDHHVMPKNQQNSAKISWDDNQAPANFAQVNRSEYASTGEFSQRNDQGFQNLLKYSGPPKPQRSISSQRKAAKFEKSEFYSTESVNWEPICASMSEWVCIEDPVVHSSQKIDEWIDIPNVELADATTNTLSFDINPENQSYFTILTPVSREINSPFLFTPVKSPGLKVALDKGTMTCDEEEFSTAETVAENKIQYLKNMQAVFNDIPEDYLQDILERCNGDLNWAVKILLDGKTEFRPMPKIEPTQAADDTARVQTKLDIPQPTIDPPVSQSLPSMQNEIFEDDSDVEKIENVCQKERSSSEMNINLKKHIEDNFIISDDYYSEHVLKLRRKMHGEKSPLKTSPENDGKQTVTASTPEPVAGPSNRSLSESSEEVEEEDAIVSVTVGKEFINNLHKIYGSYTCDNNLEPIIHMPISLLNQIHALWMESLYNQIDVQKELLKSIIKEDEDFARHLETKEKEEQIKGEVHEVPNLREIMDMEVALAQYKTNISEWKKETPDDFASRLSRQKLFQLFPEVNQEILLEVLNAHNNSFEQTCQVLLVSTGKIAINQGEDEGMKAIKQILLEHEKDLIARANKEQQTIMSSEGIVYTPDNVDGTLIKNYRKEAVQHLNIRSKYYSKAKEYYNRGMTQTATYYSQLAALHTRKHDYINSLAASEIMEANTSQSDYYTLDLHSLYVVEACQVLDMFLDKHIRLLRDKNKKKQSVKLFLITGRGLHSPGKQARIKPAVKARLKQRNLRFCEVNAGLLGVYVCAENLLTDIITEMNN